MKSMHELMNYNNTNYCCLSLNVSLSWSITGRLSDMRTTGNSLIMPGPVAREKKVSAFKTISFLVSLPESEPGTLYSDPLSRNEGNADVSRSRGDWYSMGGYERYKSPRKNPGFLNDEDNLPKGITKGDITIVTVCHPSPGEKTVTASSIPGNSCRDISGKKNDSVVYPGRSVLYSRQFHPLNRITSKEYKTPPDVWTMKGSKWIWGFMPEKAQGKLFEQ